MGRSGSGLSAIQKACLVLRELSTPGSHSLSTIVANTGINKTTVIRVLDTLVNQGFVYRDNQSRRYELGTEALIMSAVTTSASRLVDLSKASLARLSAISGDAACLIVAIGREWVCVARHEGSFAMPAHFVQVGRRLPLCLGSAGLALLGARSGQQVEELLAACATDLERYQRFTAEDVRNALELTRKRGYAISTNVIWEGTGGIAAVIPEPGGLPYAALSITAMAPRIVKRHEMLGQLLQEEAARLHAVITRHSPQGIAAAVPIDLTCLAGEGTRARRAELTLQPGESFPKVLSLLS